MKKFTFILAGLIVFFCTMQAQAQGTAYELLPNAASVKTGDINGDGFTDIVASHYSGADGIKLSVYLNDGNGSFALSESISDDRVVFPNRFLLEDFDGDGFRDIALYSGIASEDSNVDTCFLKVYFNDGNGSFDRSIEINLTQADEDWNNPYFLVMLSGDFNGDSFRDIVVSTNYLNNGMQSYGFLFNDGEGGFSAPQYVYGGSLGLPYACDLNNDNYDDIADGSLVLYLNEALPPREGELYPWDGYASCGLVVADFSGDGLLDVVEARTTEESQLRMFRNNGGEAFELTNAIDFDGEVTMSADAAENIKVMNFNGDAYPDIIVQMGNFYTDFTGYYVFEGKGGLEFEEPFMISFEAQAEDNRTFDVADVNADGYDDLLILLTTYDEQSNVSHSQLVVLLNEEGSTIPNWGQDENIVESFTLYPNPARDVITIEGAEIVEIEVFNITGQKIETVENSNTLNVSKYQAGVYCLRIKDKDGRCGVGRVEKR